MALTDRMEWNGDNWILVLENGDHGRIEMTLDEFLLLAQKLKTDLLLAGAPPRRGPHQRQD